MRAIIYSLVISIFLIMSCKPLFKKHQTAIRYNNQYYVYKIDSINNYYLVYAEKNDSLFKIISEKTGNENCKIIKKKEYYSFELTSFRDNPPKLNGVSLIPINYLDVKCFMFNDSTEICFERKIHDFHFTKNLKGLCYIENPE